MITGQPRLEHVVDGDERGGLRWLAMRGVVRGQLGTSSLGLGALACHMNVR
jgi:hypothetical protein